MTGVLLMFQFNPISKQDQTKSERLKSKNKNFTEKVKAQQKRPTKEIKCDECGVKFQRRTDMINKRSKRNFCTHQCSNKVMGRERKGTTGVRKGKMITCFVCNKEFYVTPNRAEKAKLCSKKCQGSYQQTIPVPKGFITGADNKGKKNGRYKDGKRIGTNISKKELRNKISERDGNYCLHCGKPGPGLHLHRIVYGSQGGKYEIDNCVQLCNVDHEKVHTNKNYWMPILLEYIRKNKGLQS